MMGIEFEAGFNRIEFEYQNIYDNVTLLNDELLKELNTIIVEFGQREVFKKKETTALQLKADSYVVESNVHFPTDYSLLWDCAKKCLDTIQKFPCLNGWRKCEFWKSEIKGLMRKLGKVSSSGGKDKQRRLTQVTEKYLKQARALHAKIQQSLPKLTYTSTQELNWAIELEYFCALLDRHIDLVHRRLIKGENIPHDKKLFSIFEQYTEWINKGKSRPAVELGKKVLITTDQYNLIVDYQVLDHEQERDVIITIMDRVVKQYKISSLSLDKGFYVKGMKELLETEITTVVIPKLGKRNEAEMEAERKPLFKRLKNKHSAVESNINELEHRGLDRCPDRSLPHFLRYVGLGITAYNLKKIGHKLLDNQRAAEDELKRVSQ